MWLPDSISPVEISLDQGKNKVKLNFYTFDTPIGEILGHDFWLSDKERSNEMNLRDILTQKTGISNMAAIAQMNSIKIEDLMSHLMHARQAFVFRERIFHSDLMFFVAERVAEKLGGKSYESLLNEHILKPLGMSSTTFVHNLHPSEENLATPSLKINNRQYPVSLQSMRGYKLTRAANGICSTANDMGKWLRMNLMNGINVDTGRQLISQKSLNSLYTLNINRFTEAYDLIRNRFLKPAITVSFMRQGYGMGWEIGSYRGYKLLTHGGSIPGYEAIISMLPDKRVGAYLAMTGTGGNEAMVIKTLISAFVLDVTLNNTSWINYTNVCQIMDNLMADMERNAHFRRPQFTPHIWQKGHSNGGEKKDENNHDPKLYAGRYRNHMFGNITISYNATADQLTLIYGKTGYFHLKRTTTKDTFLIKALGGLPYYMSYADNYKSDLYRYLFFNRTKDSDMDGRFESITIPDFDHNVHPVFKRPLKPVVDIEKQLDSNVSFISNGQNIIRAFSVLILSCIVNAFFIVALH